MLSRTFKASHSFKACLDPRRSSN